MGELTYSARYKRAHPEKASEYNRRANAKRTKPRWQGPPCPSCGGPKDARSRRCGKCRQAVSGRGGTPYERALARKTVA